MAKPKLALIPAAQGDKFYSVLPSSGVGDFDFTRSGGATRINSQGLIETVANGVSRLNYPLIDGKVVGCPSHLLEPQRTNLIPYSQDFSQGWNLSSATITSNSIISPYGLVNATTLDINAFGGGLSENFSVPNGNVTFSLFVKKGTTNGIRLRIDASTDSDGFFDLVNNTVYSSTDDASIESYGNDWYKVSISANITSFVKVAIYGANSEGNYQNGTIYIYGAQVEQGSYATSYIPTNGSATTRSAETATNSGDASTFNDSEGVLMAEIRTKDDGSNKFITLSDGSDDDRITIYFYTSINDDIRFQIRSNNINQPLTPNPIGYNIDEFNKIAIKYKQNDVSAYVNGFLVASNNGNIDTPLNLSELAFDDGGGASDFYGNTKQLQYFDSALTDSELEKLTSWVSFTDMANGQLYTIE